MPIGMPVGMPLLNLLTAADELNQLTAAISHSCLHQLALTM